MKWGQTDSAKERNMSTTSTATRFVRWLKGFRIDDVPLVGGKNASLGEVDRNLASQSVNVLRGFPV